jgi:CspA family cold shock protein
MMHQLESPSPSSGVLTIDRVPCGSDRKRADTVALAGIVKWFDVVKGYGFIVPDNGMADVFFHGTCLQRDGFPAAYKGCRVAVEAVPGPRGLQAARILSLEVSAVPSSPEVPSPAIVAAGPFERARVKWINRIRGFGFLTRGEGTPDIFVHVEALRRCGLGELRAGQLVRVRVGKGPKGVMAAELRPEDAPCVAVH